MAKDLQTYLSNRRTRLPRQIAVEEAAQALAESHNEHGGATFSLYFGNVAGQNLYAVSLYPEPERAITISGKSLSPADMEGFIKANLDLLADPRVCIGTWYYEDTDATYIDITAVLAEEQMAIELGRQYNQIAIYDLMRSEEIETEGTGEWTIPALPAAERLPKLQR